MNVGPRQIAWSLCSSRVCLGKGHLTRGGSTPHVHLWSALSRSFSVLISTNHWGTTNRNSIHPKYCPTLYPKSRQLVRTAGCRVKFVSLCSRTYTVNSRLEPSESDSPDFVSVGKLFLRLNSFFVLFTVYLQQQMGSENKAVSV